MVNANNLLDSSQFESNLRDAVMQYSMLKHPFYVAWTEGKLSKAVLECLCQNGAPFIGTT